MKSCGDSDGICRECLSPPEIESYFGRQIVLSGRELLASGIAEEIRAVRCVCWPPSLDHHDERQSRFESNF
jgi:hypothetical protein